MAEKRQKKQAVKAFEKETFSKDKEVTGAKHTEHRQDNTFSVENQFSAREKLRAICHRMQTMAVVQEMQLLVTTSRSRKPKRKRHS